jgi:hypothetical protein
MTANTLPKVALRSDDAILEFKHAEFFIEEDLLRRNCPEYSIFEVSRWRLVPYVW